MVYRKWCHVIEKQNMIDSNVQSFIFDEMRSEDGLRRFNSNKVCDMGIWDKNIILFNIEHAQTEISKKI